MSKTQSLLQLAFTIGFVLQVLLPIAVMIVHELEQRNFIIHNVVKQNLLSGWSSC